MLKWMIEYIILKSILYHLSIKIKKKRLWGIFSSNPYKDTCKQLFLLFKATISFLLHDYTKGKILAPGALQVLK